MKGFNKYGFPWKKDNHVVVKNRKIGNWWEDMETTVSRGRLNQIVKRQIKEEVDDLYNLIFGDEIGYIVESPKYRDYSHGL